MKKIIFGFLLILSLIYIGCDIYYDKTKDDMEVKDIKVFDSDGNEVLGNYN